MKRDQNNTRGFTLLELLIAIAIGMIVLGTIVSFFVSQNKSYSVQEQVVEMQQNARAPMDIMSREIRMTGHGAPKSNISSWINWVTGVTMDSNPKIVQGSGSDPDTIYVVGCFDSPPASLSASVSIGATSLTLDQSASETIDEFNITSKKVISINGLENAVITGIASSTLTIDTNPTTTGNQGITRAYGAGASVYLVKTITYSVVSDTLKRNENTGAGSQPSAENIQDLQISQSGDSINLSLTARTGKPDPDYSANSGYRNYTLTSSITCRNLTY